MCFFRVTTHAAIAASSTSRTANRGEDETLDALARQQQHLLGTHLFWIRCSVPSALSEPDAAVDVVERLATAFLSAMLAGTVASSCR